MVPPPLIDCFDLLFVTRTVAILAYLLALGYLVEHIHDLYKTHVPTVMAQRSPAARTAALEKLAAEVFGERTFDEVKTGIGIVATRWMTEKPMIFKSNDAQADRKSVV